MKNKINYKEKFLERGLTPLEEIYSGTQKVDCQDAEGYKYHLDYLNYNNQQYFELKILLKHY